MFYFAPFLSTHFFPCLNPIFNNGSFLSVVALVCDTFRFESASPWKKDRIWHPACAHLWGFSRLSLPAVRRRFSAERPAEGPKVEVQVFRVFGCLGLVVWGVQGVQGV